MRALQLEKLPEWLEEDLSLDWEDQPDTFQSNDLNIDWEIDQRDSCKSHRSSMSSDTSVILLADSKELDPFKETKISRVTKAECSELFEPIPDNFLQSQSAGRRQDRGEQLKMEINKAPLRTGASDLDFWKANELFTMNWKNAASQDQLVRLPFEESWRDLLKLDTPKIKLNDRKSRSSPIDVFDLDRVFDKVESLHSDSWLSESSSRGQCSNISETSESINGGRVSELEALLTNVWDHVETLTARNHELQEDKKRFEVEATTASQHFQETIDQLVAEVVRLEDESEESRILMSYI